MTGCRLGASICSRARSWTLSVPTTLAPVAALVAEHHLDAAIGALDDVEVGEHVAGLVENEARALALLRHRSIKEVEDQRGGSDVDHRGQHALVDGDIVLLLGVVGGRGLSLGELERETGAVTAERARFGRETVRPAGRCVVRNQNPPTSRTTRRTRRNVS